MEMTQKKELTRQEISRKLVLLGASVLFVAYLLVLPKFAFADPHAMFFTDRGQEQVFYNVLAALNQADYVEPPLNVNPYENPYQSNINPTPTDGPFIASDIRQGNYIATGQYQDDPVQRTVDSNGNVNPAIEPQERDTLPRIRVREVTSDNGDVFFRESMERRALAEELRAQLAYLACRGDAIIYGDTQARKGEFCPMISPPPTT